MATTSAEYPIEAVRAPESKAFPRLALVATAAVYVLIFVGGLVRVSGAGLGCPDWPQCYGRWIPPVHAGQLPPGVDAAHFNFTLAWIEYVNRLVGVGIGLLVVGTLVLALRTPRRDRVTAAAAAGAAILVAVEGWLGGKVVRSELDPLLVSIHMGLAVLIASLLVVVTHRAAAGVIAGPAPEDAEEPGAGGRASAPGVHERTRRGLARRFTALWTLSVIQVFLGAHLRGSLEELAGAHPLLSDHELFERLGAGKFLHIGAGLLLAVLAADLGLRRYRDVVRAAPRSVATTRIVTALILAQTALGFAMGRVGLVPILQLFHLWIASVAVGAVLLVLLDLRAGASQRGVRVLGGASGRWISAAAVALAVVAVLVIGGAEASRLPPVGGEVGPFSLREVGGGTVTESDLGGRITVVGLLGHDAGRGDLADLRWLAPFRRQAAAPASAPVQVLFISLDGGPEVERATAERFVAESLQLDRRPGPGRFVLIDADGRLRGVYDGTVGGELDLLRAHVRELARRRGT